MAEEREHRTRETKVSYKIVGNDVGVVYTTGDLAAAKRAYDRGDFGQTSTSHEQPSPYERQQWPKAFREMVAEKLKGIPLLSPQEVQRRVKYEPSTLVLNIVDGKSAKELGVIPGLVNIEFKNLKPIVDKGVSYQSSMDKDSSSEMYSLKAYNRDRPIITACTDGEQALRAVKLLKDMGFTNVSIFEGSPKGWKPE